MHRNPEFQRNFWLEITPHRLIATPLIFGGFYYLILFFGEHGDQALLLTSLWMFILFSGLWGAYLSENALVTEIQNKTWPLQRLTSINPWSMTWGKLFGSTLFSWYVGLWSLGVFVLTLILAPDIFLFPRPDHKWIMLSHGIVPAVLFIVGVVIWFQAWGFLLGMWQAQNRFSKSKRRSGMSLLLGLLLLPSVILSSFEPVKWSKAVHWYHWEFSEFWFWLASLYLFLAWTITGVYMQMRRELQVANPPWVWKAFLIFVLVYAMGFPQEKDIISLNGLNFWVARLLLGWGLMVAFTYVILLWERSDGVDIRRLFHLWRSHRIQAALCEIPRWLVASILAWATAAGLLALHALLGGTFLNDEGDMINLYGWVAAAMCFLMRDIALLLYFYFSDKPQRALATAVVYWTVLYILIPMLLGVVWMDIFNPLFLPDGSVNFAYAVAPPLLQAVLMWRATIRRWRTRFGALAI